jgi:hypothetical protein
MESKFFTFFAPYFNFIDSGKFFREPFKYLYMLIAGANIFYPLYILYWALDENILDAPGKVLFLFILLWAVIAVAGLLSFQLWWNRKDKVIINAGADFTSTPAFAHFIQTAGEYLGSWCAVVGVLFGLITLVFEEASVLGKYLLAGPFSELPIGVGMNGILYSVIYGFVYIVFFRVLAEILNGIITIANNSKK